MKKLVVCGAVLLMVVSCKKKEEIKVELDRDVASSTDNAISNILWEDVFKRSDEAIQNEGAAARSCGTVTVNPLISFPKTVTIDFGTGCTGADGRTRSGIIEAVITGLRRDLGTVITITPSNYVVDGYSVAGTKTITNMGRVNGIIHFNRVVSGAQIVAPNGDSWSWNSDVTSKFVEGESTTFVTDGVNGILDDVYHIDGASSGVNRNGVPYTCQTTTDIRKELSCKWPVSGVFELTPQNKPTRVVDYGNGACDSDATVSVNGYTINIQLQ